MSIVPSDTEGWSDRGSLTVLGDYRLLHGGKTDGPLLLLPTTDPGYACPSSVKQQLTAGKEPLLLLTGPDRAHPIPLRPGTPLFDGMRLSAALTSAISDFSRNGIDATSWTPLFHFRPLGQHGEQRVFSYGQIRHLGGTCLFVRLSEDHHVLPADGLREAVPRLVRDAAVVHDRHANYLNNHQGYYERLFAGRELEYKLTMETPADLWGYINECHHRVLSGAMPGFFPEYDDELQRFDFVNVLYEVDQPEAEAGYLSFGRNSAGHWIVKRKWFTEDAYDRREVVWKNVALQGDLSGDLTEVDFRPEIRRLHGVEARPLGSFRRIRYDLNLESGRTGHLYGILADECRVVGEPDRVLRQVEIEYLRTRSLVRPDPGTVQEEMEQTREFAESVLRDRGIPYKPTFFSKLSFMRGDVHPGAGV